jgi:hypothetical protein
LTAIVSLAQRSASIPVAVATSVTRLRTPTSSCGLRTWIVRVRAGGACPRGLSLTSLSP